MGASKRDIHLKAREYDDTYAYTDAGISVLLKDIIRLDESRIYRGDIDATAIITDLKMALDSDCLTPRMRQVVALYYFVGLTEEEAAHILHYSERKAVNKSLNSAIERIAEEMSRGGSRKKGHGDFLFSSESQVYKWLNEVGAGLAPIYEVPISTFTDILERSKHSDKKAEETLYQRKGIVTFTVDYTDVDEYPAYTEDQFKWRDRRMMFKPEIYPKGDVTGTRTVAIKLRDGDESGNEWIVEKRKMFAKRGN
ncbi:RNA polymerase sigma factor [Peribacillus simplex]|uniref:RNA polymerase sigma factor n=1 Tax=Peribacillus simplex TaxID=1478 RepID=UPI0034E8E6B8